MLMNILIQENNKKNEKKVLIYENEIPILRGKQKVLKGFESKLFSIGNQTNRKDLNILTPKHIFQRLPIALAKVKAGNTSENLLNESVKQCILRIKQKKLLKSHITI